MSATPQAQDWLAALPHIWRTTAPERPHLRLVALNPGSAQGGDGAAARQALSDLFQRHAQYIAGVVHRILGRDADVDDVVQEVFCAAFKQYHSLTDVADLRGWLVTVAVRSAGKRLRRRQLKRRLGIVDAPNYEEMAGSDASAEERLTIRRIYLTLDRLPVRQRIAWELRYVEGLSLDEVAERIEASRSTCKRDIQSAQDALQRELGHD